MNRWEFHYNLDDEVEGKNIRVDFRVVLVLFANFVYRERAFFMFLAEFDRDPTTEILKVMWRDVRLGNEPGFRLLKISRKRHCSEF
jgi:hypothetical protein